MKRNTKKGKGFTFIELLAIIIAVGVLSLIGFSLLGVVSQKIKVARAQAYITQAATLLEVVKYDINYYPKSVTETLDFLTSHTGPSGLESGWRGPYLKETPIDPWGKPYFYKVEVKIFFGPVFCQRLTGGPFDQIYSFAATPGQGEIIIDNSTEIIHSGTVWLNGVEIVSQHEFTKDQPFVKKSVTLLANNTLRVRLTSNPSHYILVTIGGFTDLNSGYALGSFGSDNEPGGDGFARDLVWTSGQPTANFGDHW